MCYIYSWSSIQIWFVCTLILIHLLFTSLLTSSGECGIKATFFFSFFWFCIHSNVQPCTHVHVHMIFTSFLVLPLQVITYITRCFIWSTWKRSLTYAVCINERSLKSSRGVSLFTTTLEQRWSFFVVKILIRNCSLLVPFLWLFTLRFFARTLKFIINNAF